MTTLRQWLEIQRESGVDSRAVVAHPENRELGVAVGACPGCGAEPFLIRASAPRIMAGKSDMLQANGYAKCCGDPVGYVYAKKNTLFGLEEDRAVLEFGRARVYR